MSENGTCPNSGEWLTVAQAMGALGKSDKSIRRMIERGDLRAAKVKTATGQEWRIVAADVARFTRGETDTAGQYRTSTGQVPDTNGRVPDSTGQETAEATEGETDSTGQVPDTAGASAGSTAEALDTRRLDRMEGYLAGQMEATIALAVERAVLAAQAPLLARIGELSAQITAMAQAMPTAAQDGSQSGQSTAGDQEAQAGSRGAGKAVERQVLPARHADRVGLRGFLLRILRG